jgi:hypothetical protein
MVLRDAVVSQHAAVVKDAAQPQGEAATLSAVVRSGAAAMQG